MRFGMRVRSNVNVTTIMTMYTIIRQKSGIFSKLERDIHCVHKEIKWRHFPCGQMGIDHEVQHFFVVSHYTRLNGYVTMNFRICPLCSIRSEYERSRHTIFPRTEYSRTKTMKWKLHRRRRRYTVEGIGGQEPVWRGKRDIYESARERDIRIEGYTSVAM